jgi:hypothetical protein
MDDEPTDSQGSYPLKRSPAKLSKTPSWVMLGFILGALTVYAMMRHPQTAAPAPVRVQFVDPPKPVGPRPPPPLSTIETVFELWGEHAVWSDNTTEVALWNKQERAFAEFYEVRRIGGVNYFRSIPNLTRRVLTHGKALPDSPLQFTETEEQYQEWRDHGRRERPVEGLPRQDAPIPRPPPPQPPRPTPP